MECVFRYRLGLNQTPFSFWKTDFLGGVRASGRDKQAGTGICLSVAGMLTGVSISYKFCRAIKQNCSFNFWQAGYNSTWRPLFGSYKNQIYLQNPNLQNDINQGTQFPPRINFQRFGGAGPGAVAKAGQGTMHLAWRQKGLMTQVRGSSLRETGGEN